MAVPSPFREHAGQFMIDLLGARAVFSTRRGGASRGPHASLNVGFTTGDDPATQDRNRSILRESVGAPAVAWMYQVHGRAVGVLADPAQLADRPRVDGRVTACRGVALGALGADCLTVVIAGGGAVAVLHAGWRGLAAGVLGVGVTRIREIGKTAVSDAPPRLSAAIGAGAGPCCYVVGPEVHAAFADRPQAHQGAKLDLVAVARAQLAEAGVDEVHALGLCTICEPALFFSHRRDRGVTGRQAAVAWLT